LSKSFTKLRERGSRIIRAESIGWWAWTRAPRPAAHAGVAVAGVYRPPQRASLWRPWGRPAFRRLLAVFMLNGIASAIPATLVLFFIQDRLQAPPAQEPMFLAAYFVCAALSIPLWLRAVARWGLARTWLAGRHAAGDCRVCVDCVSGRG
jgi:Na+/melibiose symporter-like transporter